MTDNSVRQLATSVDLTLLDSGLIGVAMNRRFGQAFDVPFGQVRFEAEAQKVRHFGLQNNWEVNLPVGLRYQPQSRLFAQHQPDLRQNQYHAQIGQEKPWRQDWQRDAQGVRDQNGDPLQREVQQEHPVA